MKLFTTPVSVVAGDLLKPLCKPEEVLFLDIETTGLSPSKAQIYLIGALTFHADSGWMLRQWFADRLSAEAEILKDFFSLAASRRLLIHYNGDRFDLPFLKRCAAQYGIRPPFAAQKSLDLYRVARRLRKLFPTEHVKQQSMEHFLGISREDHLQGADLIPVYQDWLLTNAPDLLQTLRLHNQEDVLSLPALLSLLSYRDFFSGSFECMQPKVEESRLSFPFRSAISLPKPVSCRLSSFDLSALEDCLTLTVPVYRGAFLHYFKNYRDYYFLPMENRAIHKSVAEFVDRSMRVKASAKTAYTVREGLFIPLPGQAEALQEASPGLLFFRRSHQDKTLYTELCPPLLSDCCFRLTYLHSVLKEGGVLSS